MTTKEAKEIRDDRPLDEKATVIAIRKSLK